MLAFLATLVAALVVNLLIAPAAEAHDALQAATPAQDATVSSELSEVALTFNEAPLGGLRSGIIVQVIGPSGAEASVGEVRILDRTLSRSVSITEAGPHTVTWRTVSADGHPIDGSYTFTYAGPLPTPQAATTSSAPTGSVTPAPDATQPTPLASSKGASATPVGLLIVIGVFILLAIAAAVWIVVSSGRRRATRS